MKDMVERINVEHGAITRHVGEMRAGVTGKEVRDIVRREVVDALDVRNVSMIPQPDVKNIIFQQNIESLIQEGRLNDTFQTALSSNDQTLVVFTCELLNTTQVFNSATCPLFQSVPLSLIQQLSMDLGEKTEVQHAYLHSQ
jgi:enhancer of mRNA-decapping protein 4